MKKILTLIVVLFFISFRATAANIQLGVDYDIISKPLSNSVTPTGIIDVKEFFSFNCIHCKDMEPLIEQLTASDKKVHIERIQVVWDNMYLEYAKLCATLNLLNWPNLYRLAFDAIFKGANLQDVKKLRAFLGNSGLKPEQIEQFFSTYNSFTVNSKVEQYKEMTNNYNITATPTFIVNSKYIISPAPAAKTIEVIKALSSQLSKNMK